MTAERLERLLINAFEYAINMGGDETEELIRATKITSAELEEIGYEKDSFESMHEIADNYND